MEMRAVSAVVGVGVEVNGWGVWVNIKFNESEV